ncbi:MAG: hypothetical protein Q9196_003123, partial [Gyalolechia fulgens]
MANPPESSQEGSSSTSGRLRSASMKFLESDPPPGMWHATADALAKAPLPTEIRRGSYSRNGWDGEMQRRYSNISEESAQRISRQNSERLSRQSSEQAPGSLTKTPTSPLDTHHESHEEVHDEARRGGPGDELPDFFGRGEMSDQSYIPKSELRTPKDPSDESLN